MCIRDSCDTYDIKYPGVVAVYLEGAPNPGVGPQDIALAIIGAVYKCGYCLLYTSIAGGAGCRGRKERIIEKVIK